MNDLTQILTTVSSWAVSITAIIGALALIFKPIRKLIGKIIGANKSKDELKKSIDEVKSDLKEVKADLGEIKKSNVLRDIDSKEMREDIVGLSNQIRKVAEENDDNERSRIRRDIMKYGQIARKGNPISEREFESLRMDYDKYHGPLHGNGLVTEEYEFVRDYYNTHYAEWM